MPGRLALLLLSASLTSCSPLAYRPNWSKPAQVCGPSPTLPESLEAFKSETASATASLLKLHRISPANRDATHPKRTAKHPESIEAHKLQLEWARGDTFPSVIFPDGKPLRLDPFLRSQQLHRISRITANPNHQQIAMIATHRITQTPTLLTIDRDTQAWQRFDIAAYDAMWANNSDLLVTSLENERPTQLYVVSPNHSLRLVQHQEGLASSILIQKSRDGEYVIVYDTGPSTTKVAIYDASALDTPRFILRNEPTGVRCTSWRGSVTCLSFASNPYGDIVRLASKGKREVLVSGDAATPCINLDADQTRLVAFCQKNTATILKILSADGGTPQLISPPGPVTTLEPAPVDDKSDTLAVRINSFLEPPTTVELSTLKNHPPLSQDLPYHEESLSSVSNDGTVVPISLVRPDRPTALFIEVYGSYGVSSRATHSRLHNLLLERGVAIAVVHVRGGQEGGPQWHTLALGINKQRSIEDLRAATETLRNRFGIAAPRTFAAGRSAGGWLVSKTALTYPHLFGGLVLEAPLLNLQTATSDPRAPLHQQEVYEWGTQSAATLSAWPLQASATLSFDVAALVPMRDVLTSPRDALLFTHAVRCTPPQSKRVFVMELPNSGHSGPDTREEQRRWEDLQVAFIGLSE
jgi:protease II